MGSLRELPTCMSVLALLAYILIPPSNIEIKALVSFPVPFPRRQPSLVLVHTEDDKLLQLEPLLLTSLKLSHEVSGKTPIHIDRYVGMAHLGTPKLKADGTVEKAQHLSSTEGTCSLTNIFAFSSLSEELSILFTYTENYLLQKQLNNFSKLLLTFLESTLLQGSQIQMGSYNHSPLPVPPALSHTGNSSCPGVSTEITSPFPKQSSCSAVAQHSRSEDD